MEAAYVSTSKRNENISFSLRCSYIETNFMLRLRYFYIETKKMFGFVSDISKSSTKLFCIVQRSF